MSVKKIVITKGVYNDKELRLLVSFDENDKPLDIINLDNTKIGTVCIATVEKVLNDIEACICKLSTGDKGFIEFRKLNPEFYIEKHSDKKLVCQQDKFYVQISQDRKGVKPYSCNFVNSIESSNNQDFIDYYINRFVSGEYEIVSDLDEVNSKSLNVRAYKDDTISLWSLYDFTKMLDRLCSRIIHLNCGGNIVIEPTEALTVIDVNSSKNSGKTSAFDTNKEAIIEISRQLRLRSISGIIIIDLLKVSKEQQQELIKLFKEYTKDDISIISIHEFTHLGLLEMTRSRIFSPFEI